MGQRSRMIRLLKIPLLLFLTFWLLGPLAQAKEGFRIQESREILALVKEGQGQKTLKSFSGQRIAPRLLLLDAKQSGAAETLRQIKSRTEVLAAEINDTIKLAGLSRDPLMGRMWSFENTRKKQFLLGPYQQERGSKPLTVSSRKDSDIDLAQAWRISKGSLGTVVAVIDSGIDYLHPDLEGNIWQNKGETSDGIDNDGNGFVDDIWGWNTRDDSNNSWDDNGHGTHVAGIIGARGNNNQAISGINQRVSLMSVKAFDDYGMGSDSSVVAATLYAIDNGAKVINASFAYGKAMPVLEMIIKAHPEVLVVAAAGNEGRDLGRRKAYPCSLDSDNVICVGASNPSDQLPFFSNYGKGVDLAAPGDFVLSLAPFYVPCPSTPFESSCQEQIDFTPSTEAFVSEWQSGGEGGDWGVVSAPYRGKTWSGVSDSLSGNYRANSDSWALSPIKSLEGPAKNTCIYEAQFAGQTQAAQDRHTFEISLDGGETFREIHETYGGLYFSFGNFYLTVWEPIPNSLGQEDFRLRYRLRSDGRWQEEGIWIVASRVICPGDLANTQILSGTSMSAPHVSGVAGLLLAKSPQATPQELRRAVVTGSDRRPSLRRYIAGGKRLNARGALISLGRGK